MLIGNDILALESFVLNIGLGHAIVESCGVKITIRARQKGKFLRRKLFIDNDGVVPPRSEAMIPLLPVPLPDNRNFLFHLATQTNLTLFAHIINHETTKVLVKNTSNQPLRILRCQKLGHVVDIRYDNYFLADTKSALNSATFPPQASLFFKYKLSCISIPADPSMKTRLDNGVRVYEDEHAVILLVQLVVKYPSIWESKGFVQISLKCWMKVLLKSRWEAKVFTIKPKVYLLGNKARQLIDKTFDKMHRLDRLKFTTEHTPFSFPVFVIWKNDAEGKRKGRAVVDIQKLNKMVLPDFYPLLLQSEIIANI